MMRKIDYVKKGACIGAAVLLLGACGQANNADSVSMEAVVESSVEETSVQEEKETTQAEKTEADKEEANKDETNKEETEKETEKEDSAEEQENEEEGEDADKKESAEAEKESSEEKETAPSKEESAAAEETKAETADSAQAAGKSISDIYGEISQTVSLNSPMLVPDDFIMNYYGIDVNTLDEYVFSMSEAAISAETVVILKAKDAGSTGALKDSLQMVIDQKRSEMENYLPDQFQIVDKSSVQVKGNYVYLVISDQADAINRIIQAEIQ